MACASASDGTPRRNDELTRQFATAPAATTAAGIGELSRACIRERDLLNSRQRVMGLSAKCLRLFTSFRLSIEDQTH